uniref:Ku70/Ku80 N-terminal alpha/beta domain-containing protein n=1 Tax=Timema tahoe TaxID=61484 RepID=A0A7R9IMX5_9NEOP|nr:unnamed protein product [Timema tahoe]
MTSPSSTTSLGDAQASTLYTRSTMAVIKAVVYDILLTILGSVHATCSQQTDHGDMRWSLFYARIHARGWRWGLPFYITLCNRVDQGISISVPNKDLCDDILSDFSSYNPLHNDLSSTLQGWFTTPHYRHRHQSWVDPCQDIYNGKRKYYHGTMSVFSCSKDEVSIILLGSENTDNNLNYKNICLAYPLGAPNWNMIEYIEKGIQPSLVDADWFEALILGLDVLKKRTTEGMRGKQKQRKRHHMTERERATRRQGNDGEAPRPKLSTEHEFLSSTYVTLFPGIPSDAWCLQLDSVSLRTQFIVRGGVIGDVLPQHSIIGRMAALEQVQSSLAPRLCHRQRCNWSGATLFFMLRRYFGAVLQ